MYNSHTAKNEWNDKCRLLLLDSIVSTDKCDQGYSGEIDGETRVETVLYAF